MENIELSECIYEHIKDTFYYGVFGDFKLVIDKATNCFNATKLCALGDKTFKYWTRLEKTKKLLEYYQESWGGDSHLSFYEVKLQNNDKLNKQVTGTYVPKELILDIASWVSIEFYDRCNNIIINYFVKEFKNMDDETLKQKIKEIEESMEKLTIEKNEVIKVKDDKIDELKEIMLRLEKSREEDQKIMLRQEQYMRSLGISLEEVKDQNEELLDNNKGLKKEVKKVQHKLGIAVEDRAPQPEDESKRERFVLLKRNDPEFMGYYTIRAQDSYTTKKLKTQRTLFPNLVVLLDFKCSPNSKTLYNRIKENLKLKNVTFKNNDIEIEDSQITEEELVDEMKVINDSKRDV
jgi:hypothetical protein